MQTNTILHWNPNYGKFNLVEHNSVATIPYEFKNLINNNVNSCIFKSLNDEIVFLFPYLINQWKIENLVNKITKRIQISFYQIEKDKILIKIENYTKRISLKDKLDSQIMVYDWNEKSINRIINISEQAIIKIPSEFTYIKECCPQHLTMTHYKSEINFVTIKWQSPIHNIKQTIIKKKGFDLKTNLISKKRVILNKTTIKGIEIDIKLDINSSDLNNPFNKIIRNIIYKPILN